MRETIGLLAACACLALWLMPAAAEQRPDRRAASSPAAALFHEGLMLERAQGKLQDAIFRYERVVAEFPQDREIVPQALYQLALAYEKDNASRSTMILRRIVAEYPEAAPFAANARVKLAARQRADRGVFEPRTLDPRFALGSPDGRLVIYQKGGDSRGPMYLRTLATGAERVLTGLDNSACFAWSPDNRHLFCFTPAATLVIATIETGEIKPLTIRGNPWGWTTKGELLTLRYSGPTNTIEYFLTPAAGGESKKVYTAPMRETGPAGMLPDGSALIMPRSGRLVRIDTATGMETPLTGGSAEEREPIVSPDGRLVAFTSNRDGRWALYVAPLDRLPVSNPVRVADVSPTSLGGPRDGRTHWWAADGTLTLAMTVIETDVYRVNLDAAARAVDAPRRLTQDAVRNVYPAISPDGRSIAYNFFGANGWTGLAVMDATGAGERPLIPQLGNGRLEWRSVDELLFWDADTVAGQRAVISSLNVKTGVRHTFAQAPENYWFNVPARQEMLYLRLGPRRAVTILAQSPNGQNSRTVATIENMSQQMAVSPDGRLIAYAVFAANSYRCEIGLLTIEGVKEKTLVPAIEPCASPIAWSPNGRHILLTSHASTSPTAPRVLDVETGEVRRLHESTGEEGWFGGGWSPDGSFVVLNRTQRRKERPAWSGVTYGAVQKLLAGSRR